MKKTGGERLGCVDDNRVKTQGHSHVPEKKERRYLLKRQTKKAAEYTHNAELRK